MSGDELTSRRSLMLRLALCLAAMSPFLLAFHMHFVFAANPAVDGYDADAMFPTQGVLALIALVFLNPLIYLIVILAAAKFFNASFLISIAALLIAVIGGFFSTLYVIYTTSKLGVFFAYGSLLLFCIGLFYSVVLSFRS